MNDAVPLVSVCIPSYNCENYISQAVESVLNQTFGDFELVILDDQSTDRTFDIVSSYHDERIKFIRNETNIGAEANWNKALSIARGKYIKLLCSDDYLYPQCLERQVTILEDVLYSEVVLVSCRRDVVRPDGRRVTTRGFRGMGGRKSGTVAMRKSLAAGTNLIGEPAAVLFRAEAVERVGAFDAGIGYLIDLDFWYRLLLLGDIYLIPEPLCAFRVRRGAWSVDIGWSQARSMCQFIDKLHAEGKLGLTTSLRVRGKLMAFVNAAMRQLFYRLVLPSGR